jgi:hypothetical protein
MNQLPEHLVGNTGLGYSLIGLRHESGIGTNDRK